MYTIKMENDKSLVTTIKSTIYRGELNANRILFLLPNEWEEHLMADYGVRLDYILPDEVGYSEMLAAEPDGYKGYLQFYVPLDSPMTAQVGKVELWLSVLDRDGAVVIKTGSVCLAVEERKAIADYYPAEKRELIAALAGDVETLKHTKADNLIYDTKDNFLQLTAEGQPIGGKVSTTKIVNDASAIIQFGANGGAQAPPEEEDKPGENVIEF